MDVLSSRNSNVWIRLHMPQLERVSIDEYVNMARTRVADILPHNTAVNLVNPTLVNAHISIFRVDVFLKQVPGRAVPVVQLHQCIGWATLFTTQGLGKPNYPMTTVVYRDIAHPLTPTMCFFFNPWSMTKQTTRFFSFSFF